MAQAANLEQSNQFAVVMMAMFATIVAAVIVSTLLVLSLMRGEFASAIAEVNTNAPTTQTVSAGSDACTGTSTPQTGSAAHGAGHGHGAVSHKAWGYGSVSGSYNNTSSSSVTNNVSETNVITTTTTNNTATDSFNFGSYNQVASNNTDNSVTNVASGNTTNTTNTVASNNTTNLNSNNSVTDSHDTETEIEDVIVVVL